jgi:hypothetical protein
MREIHSVRCPSAWLRPGFALAAVAASCTSLLAHESEITVARTAAGRLVGHNHAVSAVVLEPSVFPGIDGFASGLVGFHSADLDEPAEDLFALSEACGIEAVLVSIDPGLILHDGLHVMQPGDAMSFGTPFFDYHPLFQIDPDHADQELSLQLLFRDVNGVYSQSEPMIMTFLGTARPACHADYNLDGGVDGADVDAFFADWEAGVDEADVDGDGGVDGADVAAFFGQWEQGGC